MDEMWVRKLCDAALTDEPPIGLIARSSLRAGIALRRWHRVRNGLVSGVAVIAIAAAVPAVNQVVKGSSRGGAGPTSAAGVLPDGPGLGSHGDWPVRLAFSPDSKIVVTADSDGTARLWSVATRREIGSPMRLSSPARVEDVAFSPDGKTVATADSDGTARLWSVATQRQLGAPIIVSHVQVISVAFSPDGKLLATMGVGWRVRLWNVATRSQVGGAMFAGMPSLDTLEALTFTRNGKFLASLGFGVRLWNTTTQRRICSPLGYGIVGGMAFSPDGKILATVADGTKLWHVAAGRCTGIAILPKAVGSWGAFSSSGQILITVDTDGTIRQWSVTTHRQIRPQIVPRHRPSSLLAAVLSPNGKFVVTTQFYGPALFWPLAG